MQTQGLSGKISKPEEIDLAQVMKFARSSSAYSEVKYLRFFVFKLLNGCEFP